MQPYCKLLPVSVYVLCMSTNYLIGILVFLKTIPPNKADA